MTEEPKHTPPITEPFGVPVPKFTGRTAVLFGILAFLPALAAALVGEYTFALPLLAAAAGFAALPLYHGGRAAILCAGLFCAAALVGMGRSLRIPFLIFIFGFLFLALTISLCAAKGVSRTGMTAAGAGVLAIFITAAFLCALFRIYGGLNGEVFTRFREDVTDSFIATVQAVNAEYRQSLAELGGDAAAILETIPGDGEVEQTVRLASDVLTAALPGLLGALCCCLAHFSSFLFCLFAKYYRKFSFSSPEKERVCIALPGAILFFLGVLMPLFFGDGILSVVGENFFLLYLPGCALMGIHELFPSKKRGEPVRRRGFFLPFLLILAFFLNPLYLPILLALIGASASIRIAIRRARKNRDE